jgi:hypothetical protein
MGGFLSNKFLPLSRYRLTLKEGNYAPCKRQRSDRGLLDSSPRYFFSISFSPGAFEIANLPMWNYIEGNNFLIMKPKDFLRSVILIAVLSAFGISSGVASDKDEAKHSSKITKTRAERIALTKVPGGRIRSAELETARGQRFWSVYIAKPGSKNAKEIRVDAASGKILAVQTERPEDQAEEPPKTH